MQTHGNTQLMHLHFCQLQRENAHGKKWIADACCCVVIAFRNVSENKGEVEPAGANQKLSQFPKKVMRKFHDLAPPGPSQCSLLLYEWYQCHLECTNPSQHQTAYQESL